MNKKIIVDGKEIGDNCPCYIIAEMSANHGQKYEHAVEIIKRAKEAGADAVKLQTYTPDTITINSNKRDFQITQGTIWDGLTLYSLYDKAYMPWEWQPKLMETAKSEGVTLFSSPFDLTSVDFLEKIDVPAYKIASFEITDIPLIKKVSALKKPILISTGIAEINDICEALKTCKEQENEDVILLKCVSAYPTPLKNINLKTICNMKETFNCVAGISDHTIANTVALGAVALGAKVVEKHFTLDRSKGGADASFSMEPYEFKEMVKAIKDLEDALGAVTYELSHMQIKSREHSRSLYAVENIKKGEALTADNVRSVRPAFGLHTKHYFTILGKQAKINIEKGTAITWDLIK